MKKYDLALRYTYATICVIVVIFVIASIAGGRRVNGISFEDVDMMSYGWQIIEEDGSISDIEIPNRATDRKEFTIFVKFDERVSDGSTMFIWSQAQDITVSIDDKVIYEYVYESVDRLNSFAVKQYIEVPMKASYQGSTIYITYKSHSDERIYSSIGKIYIGDRAHIVLKIITAEFFVLFVAVVMMAVGAGYIIRHIFHVVRKRVDNGHYVYYYQGIYMLVMGDWLIIQTESAQFLIQDMNLSRNMYYLCLLVVPIALMLAIDNAQEGRYHKLSMCIITAIAAIDVLMLVLWLGYGVPLEKLSFVIQAIIIYVIAYIMITLIIISRKWRELYAKIRIMVYGYFGFSVCAILEFFAQHDLQGRGILMAVGAIYFSFAILYTTAAGLDKRREAQLELKAFESAQKNFIAAISHEIRTPINTMLGLNELIYKESREPEIRAYADDIDRAGKVLVSLVDDILDYTKYTSGKLELHNVEYDIASLINDCIIRVEKSAQDKGLKLEVTAQDTIPSRLKGDAVRIEQILMNFLTNSVKYTMKGGIYFDAKFEKISEDEINLMISVEDTGVGVSQADIDVIFMPFEKLGDVDNRHIEGAGLGLSITRILVENMGGTIEMSGEVGVGTCFKVSLPQKIIDAAPIGDLEAHRTEKKKHQKMNSHFVAPEAKMLVVDDNEMNLVVFKGLLKNTNMQIDIANGGRCGVEMSMNTRYDIIFMDHMMPEIDGITALGMIRNDNANPNAMTPIVALTANAVEGADKMYIEKGFVAYLSKPVTSDELERVALLLLPEDMVSVIDDEDVSDLDDIIDEDKEVKETKHSYDYPDWMDVDAAISFCGDESLLIMTIKMLANGAMDVCAQLQEFIENKDVSNFTTKVHGMKSTLKLVGAFAQSEKAMALEMAGKENNIEYINENYEEFLEIYKDTAFELAKVIGQEADKEKPLIDKSMLLDAYQSLAEFAQDMEYDLIEMVLSSIDDYSIIQQEEGRVEEIKKNFKKLYYEQIEKIALEGARALSQM